MSFFDHFLGKKSFHINLEKEKIFKKKCQLVEDQFFLQFCLSNLLQWVSCMFTVHLVQFRELLTSEHALEDFIILHKLVIKL